MTPLLEHIHKNRQDAVFWLVERYMIEAAAGPHEKAQAIDKIVVLLSKIANPLVQTAYAEAVAATKRYGIKIKQLQDVLSNIIEVKNDPDDDKTNLDKLPKWMDRDEVEMRGFATVKTQERVGYYGWGASGKMEISNFIVFPIFHVKGEADNSRHIFEVQNRVKRVLLDVPSKVFISLETFQTHLVAKGNYLFFGSKPQLLRIANELLPVFPECDEIKRLGWQSEGFFAYVNKVFVPAKEGQEAGIMDISKWGVVEVQKQNFLIPAASDVYANMRDGEDVFKHVRVLQYKKSEVTFSVWAKQMYVVYGDKGLSGAAFVLMTLFRDIVYGINTNCPHLYGYGERSSGKSQWAKSISSIFYMDRAAFNVNSGTDFAFFTYMGAFKNCPAHLNEVDDKSLREEWFQAIKAVFDGEGRVRGKMGNRTQIETQEVDSSLILTGQYISTKDDNSLVSRSLVEAFSEKTYTDDEKKQFDVLTDWQKEGLTSICVEILQYRHMVRRDYYGVYNDIVSAWRRATHGEFNQRIFQNWAHLSAMWFLFSKQMTLPVDWVSFDQICYNKAITFSKFIRSSDTLTDFWNTVAFLLDQREIVEGWDFKIVSKTEIKLRNSDGKEYTEKWEQPRKILLIRLINVHRLYQQSKNRAGVKDTMTLENLKHYISNRPYYIGQVKQTDFKRLIFRPVEQQVGPSLLSTGSTSVHTKGEAEATITSAYAFDYDLLGCDLERINPNI